MPSDAVTQRSKYLFINLTYIFFVNNYHKKNNLKKNIYKFYKNTITNFSIPNLKEHIRSILHNKYTVFKDSINNYKEDSGPSEVDWFVLASIAWRVTLYSTCLALTVTDSLLGHTQELQASLVLSACITTLTSLYTVTGKNTKYVYAIGGIYILFLLLTFYFVKTGGLLSFFIVYELFLLPSTILVWVMSPNKRGVMTSLFFLIWTQLGSMLVLLGLFAVRTVLGTDRIYLYDIRSNYINILGQSLLLFGFLMKVPTFPFYFWLVKTHVEVATSFSIFLSGFLVKIAIFGLYKFLFLFGTFTKLLAISLAYISSIVTSLLFLFQVDLKKAVAYATIQEMGQLVLSIFLIQNLNVRAISMFLLTHTMLSISFFFIVDILYRHYATRSGTAITGLFTASPKLSFTILFFLTMFRGLPFTLKHSIEFSLMGGLFSMDFSLGILWLFFIVMVGNLSYSFAFLKTLVFAPIRGKFVLDISRGEFLVFSSVGSILGFGLYMFY